MVMMEMTAHCRAEDCD